jgi:tetratricopeptide (TPR) repeat protein
MNRFLLTYGAKETDMKATYSILLAVLLGLGALTDAAETKHPAILLQEALYEEETAGNLDKAIDLYGQVLQEAADVERLAARATYQLGLCHLKKGDNEQAVQYFQTVVRNYPQQASVVKKARQELEQIQSETVGNYLYDHAPGEVWGMLANLYSGSCARAGLKNLYCNSNIHLVNDAFDHWSGGYGYYMNGTTDVVSGRVRLGGTTNRHQKYFDPSGTMLDTEIEPDGRPGREKYYTVYLNLPAPLAAGQFFPYAWGTKGPEQLAAMPFSQEGKRVLTLQNHFGGHVFEVFYLIAPAQLSIDHEEPYSSMTPVGDYVIYAWEAEVGPEESHAVTVYLSEKESGSQLIYEDSFEEGGDETPAGWEKGAPVDGVSYVWDKHTGSDGAASLCLKKDVEKYFPIAQWTRRIDYSGTAKELTVSANVRARKAYKAVIDALFLDDKGEWIKHEWVSTIGAKEAGDPPANHNWTDYSGTVEIPGNTKTIIIGLQLYGPGTVWFDELKVAYADVSVVDAKPDPLKAEELVAEGWKLWRERKLTEAEDKFSQAARSDPKKDAAWQGLGWAQLNQGKKQNAEASFKKCVKLNPENSAALNGLGWIEHGQGNMDLAITWWEKAVKASNGVATASLSGLTQVYMERKAYDKAAHYYQMWLKAEPDNQEAKEGLEKAKQAKR